MGELESMNQELRTPEAIYLKQTSVIFAKINGIIKYNILTWNDDGTQQSEIAFGILKDEEHLKQLKSATTLDELMAIHSKEAVM